MKKIENENCGAKVVLDDTHEQKENKRNHLLICGVGGAGCNMTRHLQMNVKRENIDYLVIDTDQKCLDAVPKGKKILIGKELCHGTGTGRCVQKGKDAVMESKRDLKDAIAGYMVAVILFSAGGGTGTGAGPEIIRSAKELGVETVAFVIKPFLFEAKIRNETAQRCLHGRRDENIKFAVLDNERFMQRADKQIGMAEFFEGIDNTVVEFVEKIPTSPTESRSMKEELIRTFDESAHKEVSAEFIMNVVCDHFHVTKEQVLSKTRKKDVVKARQIIMYCCKYIGGYSFYATGTVLGGRTEAVVRRAMRRVSMRYKKDGG